MTITANSHAIVSYVFTVPESQDKKSALYVVWSWLYVCGRGGGGGGGGGGGAYIKCG